MKAASRLAPAVGILMVVLSVSAGAAFAAAPRWVTHVRGYDGGISSGTRAYLDPDVVAAQALSSGPFAATGFAALNNVQMNDDSSPPLPQDETSVALDPAHPLRGDRRRQRLRLGRCLGRHDERRRPALGESADRPRVDRGRAVRRWRPVGRVQRARQRLLPRTTVLPVDGARFDIFVYKSTDSGATWSGAVGRHHETCSSSAVDDSVFYDKDMSLVTTTGPALYRTAV